VLLGLVVLLQWRRRRAHTPANPSKENADVSRDPAAG
jgi:hypothetical protein